MLNAAADALEARADAFVEAMLEEVRASDPWARFNVQLGAGMIREAAALTTQVAGEIIPSDRPGLGIEFDREAAKQHPFQMAELPQLRRLDGSFTNW